MWPTNGRTGDFYVGLLRMGGKQDNDRSQRYLTFGDSFLIPRRAGARRTSLIDHIAYVIGAWNQRQLQAELEKRGLNPRKDTPDGYQMSP